MANITFEQRVISTIVYTAQLNNGGTAVSFYDERINGTFYPYGRDAAEQVKAKKTVNSVENVSASQVLIPYHAVRMMVTMEDILHESKPDPYNCIEYHPVPPTPVVCETLIDATLSFSNSGETSGAIYDGSIEGLVSAACSYTLTVGDTVFANGVYDAEINFIFFYDADENVIAAVQLYEEDTEVVFSDAAVGDFAVTLEKCCAGGGETKKLIVYKDAGVIIIGDGSDFTDCSDILAWCQAHTSGDTFDASCMDVTVEGMPAVFGEYVEGLYMWIADGGNVVFSMGEDDGACIMSISTDK